MTLLEKTKQALIDGRDKDVGALVKDALDAKHDPKDLLNNGLIAGMEIIGERFRQREIFLPEVLMAAKAMYAGLEHIKPLLEGQRTPTKGTIVIGTVEGDLHDIGKNLVGIMLRGSGFDVIDLGKGVPAAKFVEAAKKHNADVVGMSALLTTTMTGMKTVISALKAAGLGKVKTIVGGAPLNEAFAKEIGADAYGFDAVRSVEIVKGFFK